MERYQNTQMEKNSPFVDSIRNPTVKSIILEIIKFQESINSSHNCLMYSYWFQEWLKKRWSLDQEIETSKFGSNLLTTNENEVILEDPTSITDEIEYPQMGPDVTGRCEISMHFDDCPVKSRRFTSRGDIESLFDEWMLNLMAILQADKKVARESEKKIAPQENRHLNVVEMYDMLSPILRFSGLQLTKFGNFDYEELVVQLRLKENDLNDILNDVPNIVPSNQQISSNSVPDDDDQLITVLLWSRIVSHLPLINRPQISPFRPRSVKEISDPETLNLAVVRSDEFDSVCASDYDHIQMGRLIPVSLCHESREGQHSQQLYIDIERRQRASIFHLFDDLPRSPLIPLRLPLPDGRIHLIRNPDGLFKMMSLLETIDIVGIDIEWTPPLSVSLLTLSTFSHIFCIDFTCLHQSPLYHGTVLNSLLWLLGNSKILKISHQFNIDYTRLLTALFTDEILTDMISSEMHSSGHDGRHFSQRKFLPRFLRNSIKNVVDLRSVLYFIFRM